MVNSDHIEDLAKSVIEYTFLVANEDGECIKKSFNIALTMVKIGHGVDVMLMVAGYLKNNLRR